MPEQDSYPFIVSTGRLDGNGNRADITGWVLDRYLNNPVVFFNHQRSLPPIGRANSVSTDADQLIARIQLADTALAQQIAGLIDTGYIRGASVAWLPLEWEWLRDQNGYPIGLHSYRQELLEISIVGLPANPDTLLQAATLDQGEGAAHHAPEPFQLFASPDWLSSIIGAVPSPAPPPPPPTAITTPEDLDNQSAAIAATLNQFNQTLRGAL